MFGEDRVISAGSAGTWTASTVTHSSLSIALAVAALILGIFTVTFGWCYVGVLTGPIAIVLGIISLVQIKNNPERNTGKPMAIAGIVMGTVYFVLVAIFILFAVLMQGVK